MGVMLREGFTSLPTDPAHNQHVIDGLQTHMHALIHSHACTHRFMHARTHTWTTSGVNTHELTSGCLAALDVESPVLLMRSGILRKGLPVEWQSNRVICTQR